MTTRRFDHASRFEGHRYSVDARTAERRARNAARAADEMLARLWPAIDGQPAGHRVIEGVRWKLTVIHDGAGDAGRDRWKLHAATEGYTLEVRVATIGAMDAEAFVPWARAELARAIAKKHDEALRIATSIAVSGEAAERAWMESHR